MPIDPTKKYEVGAISGKSAYARSIADAMIKGQKIAQSLAWRGKWNLMFISVDIRRQLSPGYFGKPIYSMYVPVRGTGKRADDIVAEIKRRHGVAPFVWTKK